MWPQGLLASQCVSKQHDIIAATCAGVVILTPTHLRAGLLPDKEPQQAAESADASGSTAAAADSQPMAMSQPAEAARTDAPAPEAAAPASPAGDAAEATPMSQLPGAVDTAEVRQGLDLIPTADSAAQELVNPDVDADDGFHLEAFQVRSGVLAPCIPGAVCCACTGGSAGDVQPSFLYGDRKHVQCMWASCRTRSWGHWMTSAAQSRRGTRKCLPRHPLGRALKLRLWRRAPLTSSHTRPTAPPPAPQTAAACECTCCTVSDSSITHSTR